MMEGMLVRVARLPCFEADIYIYIYISLLLMKPISFPNFTFSEVLSREVYYIFPFRGKKIYSRKIVGVYAIFFFNW